MWKCTNCGSTNVETMGWLKVNTKEEGAGNEDIFEPDEPSSNWCNGCETHCTLKENEKAKVS